MVRHWTEDYILQLQGGLEITDWSVDQSVISTDLSTDTDHITRYTKRLVEESIPIKTHFQTANNELTITSEIN